jgi:DNA-binding NarL/FixJ family response regulator
LRTRAYDADGTDRVHAPRDSPLTAREVEILQLLTAGCTNGDIAHHLVIAEQTVKFHVGNILRKLNVANRTQASHYAHIRGLVDGARPNVIAANGSGAETRRRCPVPGAA